jgi:hypothetical protein
LTEAARLPLCAKLEPHSNSLTSSAKEESTMNAADVIMIEPVALRDEDLPIDRPRPSGFVLKPIDVAAATVALKSLYADDEIEQRETFVYLSNALNETRAANGERLLFPDEPNHLA